MLIFIISDHNLPLEIVLSIIYNFRFSKFRNLVEFSNLHTIQGDPYVMDPLYC